MSALDAAACRKETTDDAGDVALHLGCFEVILQSKVSHLAIVPKSVYRGKVTSEHLVDDCGTPRRQHRSDPKVTFLCSLMTDELIARASLAYRFNPTCLSLVVIELIARTLLAYRSQAVCLLHILKK